MRARKLGILLAITVGAMLILGYHPGLEDDSFYLAAIRKQLNPALYPYDSDFFQLQFQVTLFDKLIAASVRWTHVPLEWTALLWQFAAVFAILGACFRIAGHYFEEERARWAAAGLVAALLTIPVSGTGISLVDQYLHPRAIATAAILWAVLATMERRFVTAGLLLAAAASMHIIMASFGISLCVFLAFPPRPRRAVSTSAMLMPPGWMFEPASETWRKAAATRTFYFLGNWEWYEWLGVLAPVLLLWMFGRFGRLARSSTRLVWFAIFQLAAALVMMLPPALERLRPLEPMRYLQLVYIFMFLLIGGLLGKYALRNKVWRWALLFAPLSFGMAYAQILMYPDTPHLELPGAAAQNQWVRAFSWIRENTPEQSYFALDPNYMGVPGEDFHGFRGLTARSVLADNLKDPGMVARVPRLAGRWQAESDAQSGWKNFQTADFRRLKTEFGVDWVVLSGRAMSGLPCPYQDGSLKVCRID